MSGTKNDRATTIHSLHLSGRTALVTGAARGVGREIAFGLARSGANVTLVDACASSTSVPYTGADRTELEEVGAQVKALGVGSLAIQADVRDFNSLSSAVEQTMTAFGGLDILVPNAAIFAWGRLWELTETEWDDMLDINLKGVWLTLKAALPSMIEQRWGRIITVASTSAIQGGRDYAHYVASKHGVVGLMRSLAMEVGQYSVTANVVAPSRMATPMVEHSAYIEKFSRHEKTAHGLAATTREQHVLPMDYVPPRAVADAVVWLASDAASAITGVLLPVDAGTALL